MRKILRVIKRFLSKIFGTKIDKLFWKFRHFINPNWPKNYLSKESLNHPHRKLLIEKISSYYPFESVLEVGSASGPNLYLLAKKFPKTKFYGIDVSKKAVKFGQNWFQKQGISNVFLFCREGENFLKQKINKNFDIIFTDATLIYYGPEKIEAILKEMLRVTKKAIILCEWYSEEIKSSLYQDNWIHNYRTIIEKFNKKAKVKLTKIPPEIWGGVWAKYGYIIEVIL